MAAPAMIVVFGRPGAGKTTIVQGTANRLKNCLTLDLDCCVPDWMKENFNKGIYPNLAQRREFANDCVEYVRGQLKTASSDISLVLVSFSFVNKDLRDIFRQQYSAAQWVLVNVDESTAQSRIEQRANHFYKGKVSKEMQPPTSGAAPSKHDNPDWEFAPVTFSHVVLNGLDSVETNVQRLLNMARDQVSS